MSAAITPLTDPSGIEPYCEDVLQVVIETPKGSRNKYAFDHERRVLVLKKVLPAGMIFPYDFGFVPSTLAEDGDPIDVLLLMDEPAFPGCVLDARVIGVICGEDELDGGRTQRNDRLLAVAAVSRNYEEVERADQLAGPLLKSMEEFFVNYPRILSEKTYRLLGTKGPVEAKRLIEEARVRAEEKAQGCQPA